MLFASLSVILESRPNMLLFFLKWWKTVWSSVLYSQLKKKKHLSFSPCWLLNLFVNPNTYDVFTLQLHRAVVVTHPVVIWRFSWILLMQGIGSEFSCRVSRNTFIWEHCRVLALVTHHGPGACRARSPLCCAEAPAASVPSSATSWAFTVLWGTVPRWKELRFLSVCPFCFRLTTCNYKFGSAFCGSIFRWRINNSNWENSFFPPSKRL